MCFIIMLKLIQLMICALYWITYLVSLNITYNNTWLIFRKGFFLECLHFSIKHIQTYKVQWIRQPNCRKSTMQWSPNENYIYITYNNILINYRYITPYINPGKQILGEAHWLSTSVPGWHKPNYYIFRPLREPKYKGASWGYSHLTWTHDKNDYYLLHCEC